ncbi:3697_t:CDS:2 [Paraglomus occultum]|uniref:3697_t:CDS:1 n=1 Tax=Paraglomus occultum TaxID=144539 RepID=A0A9N9B5A5_9GLOM|nr:3697_t:CDS:2 [Paraglomus occultum]
MYEKINRVYASANMNLQIIFPSADTSETDPDQEILVNVEKNSEKIKELLIVVLTLIMMPNTDT